MARRPVLLFASLFAASVVLGACSGSEPAANVSDALPLDASEDAAIPTPDAEPLPDATEPDAMEPVDAGIHPDAEPVDTGVLPDSGVPLDSGVSPDAAAPDATEPPDTGVSPPDAGPGSPDAGNACSSSLDCIPGVEVCGDIRVVNGVIETHCVHTNPTPPALSIGSSCTADPQCTTNMCLDGIANECSVACADAMRDCGAGYACTGYTYNPGNVWVYMCTRACDDDGSCAPGNPGNVCSTQVYERNGGWFVDKVCQLPAGAGALGTACTTGNDCRSGLCLTTTRSNNCTGAASCAADEACECPAGGAPPCAGGAAAACVSRLCSALCNDNGDCAVPGQSLTQCRFDINLGLPDGSVVQLASCGRS